MSNPKVKKYEGYPGHYVGFKCPGCKGFHIIPTADANVGNCWSFNYNYEKPTFTPSILSRWTRTPTDEEAARIIAGEKIEFQKMICHSYVTDGKILFLDDCTHTLRGQTVELEDV